MAQDRPEPEPIGHFLVPQFIDIETKVIGSITTRQFLILMVAGMIDFILYKLFYFNTFLMIAIPLTAIFGVVAFLKINGMPFHFFFLNLVQTLRNASLRVWKKEEIKSLPAVEKAEKKKELLLKPPIPVSKLSTLTLIVNTGGAYKPEE